METKLCEENMSLHQGTFNLERKKIIIAAEQMLNLLKVRWAQSLAWGMRDSFTVAVKLESLGRLYVGQCINKVHVEENLWDQVNAWVNDREWLDTRQGK